MGDEQVFETEVAVIGMAGRFPGARNVDEFWQNLLDGVESISYFSDQELEAAGEDPAILRHPHYIKSRPILTDIELFDAAFFGFNPREAALMDPQQRLFLECVWEALENAGYNPKTYEGRIAVYAGVGVNGYLFNLYSNPDLMASMGAFQATISNDKDYLSTRVSYKLNLRGPSVTVQTACSTSLVATHLAWQSLLNGECDMALVGGVTARVPQKVGYLYQEGMITSSDGHCRAFDAQASGTIFGSGVGVALLKRLTDALADGDCVLAVIKGSAINNDGSAKVGYTAPSQDAQAEVISEALAMARVEPETITYIEAHGTGTPLGDPIEIAALTQAFRAKTEKKGFCAIGSVKTNIGHLDTAAGVTSLIKSTLALKHKLLPPSLNFEQPNPKIDFDNSPFYVNTTLTEWKADGTPCRAGVSSFGIGGTNVHLILEEAPTVEPSGESRPWHLLPISAKSSSALETATANLVEHLKQYPDLNLADVAYTLQIGREAFDYRRMLVCRDLEDAAEALETRDPKRVLTSFQEPKHRPVAFMFSGQGAQYVNMALELYQSEPTFREHIDRCSGLLQPLLGLDLRSVLYPDEAQSEEAARQLEQTWITQPALFMIEYALARLWMEWGVCPEAMIGHSIGEYVAACLADVLSLEDALTLVAARGRLMQGLPGGAMLSVSLSAEELQSFLGEKLSVAAVNGPSLCAVSGPTDVVEALEQQLTEKGLGCRRLHTSHAFHSEMMEPILESFLEQVKQVTLRHPRIPYLSNVTGTWITETETTEPDYWVTHLRRTVRFADGVGELLKEASWFLLEVGPGQTLSTLARRHPDSTTEQVALASLPHPQDRQPARAFMLDALGRLWLAGAQVDWAGFNAPERRHRLPLPTYPFERQRYWIEPSPRTGDGYLGASAGGTSRKKPDIADWFYVPSWKSVLHPIPLKPEAEQQTCWLVFSDACGVGDQVAERLERAGHTVVCVRVGQHFAKSSEREFTIDPRQRDDYFALLSELHALDRLPEKILHLWGVTPGDKGLSGFELFEEAQYSGFYSLLFLTQPLESQKLTGTLQIWIVTNNMQAVAGEAFLCPEKITVLGPAKVIPQEHPHITCRSIDIVLPEPGTWQTEKLTNQLTAEILQTDSPEPVVAYRDHQRLVQTFEATRLSREAGSAGSLRDDGVYLIVEGLDGIGFALTETVAQAVRANLILIEDAAFPSRDRWEHWLANHDGQDSVSRKIRNAQALESMGAEVLAVQADVSDYEQMQAAIAQVDERFGELHGVVYAAGVVGEGPISPVQDTGQAEYIHHVHSKVSGLFVLEQILQGRTFDFCLLQSSLSAVLGGLGAVADTATHLFMGAFAHQHNRRNPTLWTSMHWDQWKFDEERETLATMGAGLAQLAMTLQEGQEAFRYILSGGAATQVVVSTGDLQARIDQWIGLEPARDRQSDSILRHPRPNLPTAYVAPESEIERSLADIWQGLLGVEPIGIHDNFFDLGGDSVLMMQVVAKINQVGIPLTLKQLFEHATIAELAEVAGTGTPIEAEQGLVTGPLPTLTPIQVLEVFEGDPPDPHFRTQAWLFKLRQTLEPALLEQAVQHLMMHHDALRLRFVKTESGHWQQFIAGLEGVTPFYLTDLSALPAEEQRPALEATAEKLQTSLNLEEGPIVRFDLFDLGVQKPNYLLVTLHHLITDSATWHIVLEDFQTACRQLSHGEAIQLPPKTTSFKRWTEQLAEYARSPEVMRYLDYWLAEPRSQVTPLPKDHADGVFTWDSSRTLQVYLSAEETRVLMQGVPQAYGAQIQEVLLAALLLAFTRWSGAKSLLVEVSVHGREPRFEGIDVSRTVGAFLIDYASLLTLEEEHSHPREILESVKEQIRRIPNGGFDHPVLYYLSEPTEAIQQLRALPRTEVLFSHWGQIDHLWEGALLEPDPLAIAARAHPKRVIPRLMDVYSQVFAGRLGVNWVYSKDIHRRSTIESLAEGFIEALRRILAGVDQS